MNTIRKFGVGSSAYAAVLLASFSVQAQFTPIPLTPESFNHDVVVERTATPPLMPRHYTTASMDGGAAETGNTWNERGYFSAQPHVGLPAPGTIITSLAEANHQFQFAPSYTDANNAIMLNATTFRGPYTITLPTAASYTGLSFLTSGGNGGCIFRYTIHHQDGTTETGTTPSADWFNGPNPAYVAEGRVQNETYLLANLNTGNPRLYAKDVPVTIASPVTRIDLEYVSSANNAHTCIMAISGQADVSSNFAPIPITGYNADIVVEESAPERFSMVTAPNTFTTASMDGGVPNTGNTFYEVGYAFMAPATGLPAAGSTITGAQAIPHSYVLAPSYTAPNVALLHGASSLLNVALIPQTPAAFTSLSFLGASAGGGAPIEYTITHADASEQTGTFTLPDWFNGNPTAYTASGRISNDSGILADINLTTPNTNPRLYGIDIALNNNTSPVTRIDLSLMSGTARAAFFGVSGGSGPLAPTFLAQPASVRVYTDDTATFTANVTGTQPVTYQWQRSIGGVYQDMVDGVRVSGSQTPSLTVSGAVNDDAGNYRLIANNSVSSTTSSVAVLTILSRLPVITRPTDAVTGFGGTWPDAESPANAINGNTTKYLNRGATGGVNPFTGPVGFTVTPTQGRTILGAIRFYTANDTQGRDPVDYKVEGSNNGGTTYTEIASGPLALPAARNAANLALNPLTQQLQQVLINNTVAYGTYRVSFMNVLTPSTGLFQIGEVEMLGTVDTSGAPFFSSQPANVVGQTGGSVSLTAVASGTPDPTLRWYRSINGGAFEPLTDSATISGATTGTLTISGLTANDAAQYQVVASNTAGTVTSSIATVTVLSALQDITSPSDLVEAIGDTAGTFHGASANPALAIDDTTAKYINGGSGFSAPAGFPPFQGPAGLNIYPSQGASVVKGLRVYTADANPERDPVSYMLEGSNDEVNYTVISTGTLTPSTTRNALNQPLNPLTHTQQEVLFDNQSSYTQYRLTFLDVRTPGTANSVQVAEIELLGTLGVSGPTLTIQKDGANINITWPSGSGTLEYISDLNLAGDPANWTSTGNSTGTYSEAATATMRFFRTRRLP